MPGGTTSTTKKKTTSKVATTKTKPKATSKSTTKTTSKTKVSNSTSANGRNTTKLTKKDEEIIKKRLKQLLQKEGSTRSAPKPSTSNGSAGGCSSGSCFSSTTNKKFVLTSKKPSSSSEKGYFTSKNDNVTKNKESVAKTKTKTAASKKTSDNKTKPKPTTKKTTKKSSSTSGSATYSCSNGQCTIKSKPKPKPKISGKLTCTTGGCFFLKASTKPATKTNQEKSALKRKASEIKPTVVPSKKSNPGNLKPAPKRNPKTNVKVKPAAVKSKTIPLKKQCSTSSKFNTKKATAKKEIKKSCGPCRPCGDSSDSESDYSDEDDYSDSSLSDESDFDESDEDSDYDSDQQGGCGPSRKGYSSKKYDSYESGSWETDTEDSFECKGGGCPFVKRRKISQENDSSETNKSMELALVPMKSNNEAILGSFDEKSSEEDSTDGMGYYEEGQNLLNMSTSDSSDRDYMVDDEHDSDESYSSDSDLTEEEGGYSDEYSSGNDMFGAASEAETTSHDGSQYSNSDYNFNESSNDGDYQLPENEVEDVYIRKGEAQIYPITDGDEDINFDSDASSLQVVEISSNIVTKLNEVVLQEETNDSIKSEDSCPQLVPIEGNADEINGEQYEHFDISESENEIDEQSPRMVPHVFKDIKRNNKSELFNLNLYSTQGKYQNSVHDVSNSSPLDKIANKSASLNSSQYKVITADRSLHSSLDEEVIDSLKPPTNYTKSEPYKMKAHIFEADKTNSNNLPEIVDETSLDNAVEANEVLTPIEKIITSPCNDDFKYEVITTRESFNEFEIQNQNSTERNLEFRSKFYNAINSRHVLVLLKETFYIYGSLKLKLIAGGVDVFGYNAKINEVREIFSPRGNSSLYMKPCKGADTITRSKVTSELNLLAKDFIRNDLSEILELYDETCDAIILLERNDGNKKVDMVKKYVKENLFPDMNCTTLERPFYASEFILRCTLCTARDNALNIDPHWATINIKEASKVMVIGGKSVGKSTLVRYLINRNIHQLKKFLLIDLDIGQPEVFVPQTVSATLIENPLLGPGYFYGLKPEKSYLFGDINAVLSPISYLRNVKELVKWCQEQEQFKNIPWIINTMGYNKGFGSELISAIAQILDPSNIIQIQSPREINNFDYIMTPETIKSIPRNIFSEELNSEEYEPKYQLKVFESANVKLNRSTGNEMSPKDMRFVIVISRIGTILTGRSECLSDVKPVSASVQDLDIICFSEDHIDHDDLLDVINANLVYLCRKTDNFIECYGIGIVRGVDRFHQKIYLLPSIELSTLMNVDCLAICNIPLPTSILLNQGARVKDVAPYTYNTKDFVASKHIKQICYRPQHFLQGTHRNVL